MRQPLIPLVKESSLKLNMFPDSSVLIAVGDYASEIENAVGTEIYSPIFKAGLILFASGLISAFIAAFIISKSDSWEELGNEFERGKIAQLIDLEPIPANVMPNNQQSSDMSSTVSISSSQNDENAKNSKEVGESIRKPSLVSAASSLEDMKGFDL